MDIQINMFKSRRGFVFVFLSLILLARFIQITDDIQAGIYSILFNIPELRVKQVQVLVH